MDLKELIPKESIVQKMKSISWVFATALLVSFMSTGVVLYQTIKLNKVILNDIWENGLHAGASNQNMGELVNVLINKHRPLQLNYISIQQEIRNIGSSPHLVRQREDAEKSIEENRQLLLKQLEKTRSYLQAEKDLMKLEGMRDKFVHAKQLHQIFEKLILGYLNTKASDQRSLGKRIGKIKNVSKKARRAMKKINQTLHVEARSITSDIEMNTLVFSVGLFVLLSIILVLALKSTKKTVHSVENILSDLEVKQIIIDQMLNCLGQGYFTFDRTGTCLPLYTKACLKIFGSTPENQNFSEYLAVTKRETETMKNWTEIVFSGKLDFANAAPLALKEIERGNFTDDNYQYIQLDYFPVYSSDHEDAEHLNQIIVVATDSTKEKVAKEKLKEQESFVNTMINMVDNREQFVLLIRNALDILINLHEIAHSDSDQIDPGKARILLHSLNGIISMLKDQSILSSIHKIETHVKSHIENDKTISTIKDTLKDELPETENKIMDFLKRAEKFVGSEIIDGVERKSIESNQLREFAIGLADHPELKEKFAKTFLLEPVENFVSGYDIMLQDLASKLGKRFNPMEIEGGKLAIYTPPYREFFTEMVHLVKNCAYHGIESPAERHTKGKEEAGTIHFSFEIASDNKLLVKVSDDGAGIDLVKIKEVAAQRFDEVFLTGKTDDEYIQLIFHESFSTESNVNDVSGKGLGMSALKYAVEKMRGSITIHNNPGTGVEFVFTLPLFNEKSDIC